jgi:hypothetical protein
VDNWRLTTREVATILEANNVASNHTKVAPHHNVKTSVAILRYASMDKNRAHNFAILCDSKHYRLVVMEGNKWTLFDSLGSHGSFMTNQGP